MHKFILGNNPLAPETGGLWILHLLEPICIIEVVLLGEKIHTKKALYTAQFQFTNSKGIIENWQLRMHHYFTTNFNERKNSEELCKKIMDDASHWYLAYLISQNKPFAYCQNEIEGGKMCNIQCDHCKEYYKPLEDN
jgi:hypothetical protein